jgi:hypothetical protein
MTDSSDRPSLEAALEELKKLVAPLDPPDILKAQVYLAYDQHDAATEILKSHSSGLEQAKATLDDLTATLSTVEKNNIQHEDLIQKVVPMQKNFALSAFCTLPDGSQGCLRFKSGVWTCVRC